MNEADRRRAAQQLREVQRQLDRDKHLVDAVTKARWDSSRASEVLVQVTQVFDYISQTMRNLGGIEGIAQLLTAIGTALHEFHEALPPNWSGDISIEEAIDLANAGLPVVWVPRGTILAELAAAPDRSARMAVLQGRRDELREDASRVLSEVTSAELTGQLLLARRSLEAWAAGHHEAAQALAVAVSETVITKHYAESRGYRRYHEVKKAAAIDLDTFENNSIAELRLMLAMAPVSSFYDSWYPNRGTPAPEALSRHVTVHYASPEHYSIDNALVAVLLQTSLLRAFQDVSSPMPDSSAII